MNLFQISLEHIFVISLLSGFLYSLLLYISGGKLRFFSRVFSRFRIRGFGRRKIFGGKDFAPPWLMPIVIGTYLIGFGLNGLILRVLIQLPSKESFVAAQVSSIAISIVILVIAKKFLSDSAAEIKGGVLYGTVAHVSLAIPESGMGAIAYVQDGKRVTMPARSRTGASITKGSQVVIVDLQTRIALVDVF